MNIERLDQRAIDKVSGPAWDDLRPAFTLLNDTLLSVSKDVKGELITIYIKYGGDTTSNQPFAVVWVKKASQLIVGLSMPESTQHERLVAPPKGCEYAGLTKFIIVDADLDVPDEFGDWSKVAYEARSEK